MISKRIPAAALSVGAMLLLVTSSVASPATAATATRQTTAAFDLTDFSVAGNASLVRNGTTVAARIDVRGAEAGVYTLWWMVFNNPDKCAGTPCGLPDIFEPSVRFAIGYAGGGQSRSDGSLHVASSLREGAELTGFPVAEFGMASVADTALRDAAGAEIWLVLRTHGDLIPDLADDQLRTFNGGCAYGGPIADAAPAYGEEGPNDCADSHVAIFVGG